MGRLKEEKKLPYNSPLEESLKEELGVEPLTEFNCMKNTSLIPVLLLLEEACMHIPAYTPYVSCSSKVLHVSPYWTLDKTVIYTLTVWSVQGLTSVTFLQKLC